MVAPDFAPTLAQQMGIAYGVCLLWGALSFSHIEKMNILYIYTGMPPSSYSCFYFAITFARRTYDPDKYHIHNWSPGIGRTSEFGIRVWEGRF
jgi:hypothetical protein